MRAALSSFITDASVVEVSKRSKKAKEDVRILLAKTTDTTFIEIFGEFSQAIFTEIENCVCSCVSSSDYNWVKCVSRDKLWSLFHQLRLTKLVTIWKDSFEKMGQERLDPLVEQRVNQTLFEDVLKTFIPDSQPAQKLSQLPTLSPDEENIVRYVAGYVSMKLMKKYEAQSLEVAEEFCECLSSMAVNGEESSLQAYTLEWTRTVDRGGLFEMNDETFRLFGEIEIKVQWHLMEVLKRSASASSTRQVIVDAVASDDNVQFFWVLVSFDITKEKDAVLLLKEIIGLWLTIRGFSVAGTWLEEYKKKSKSNSSKSKGLRKGLKRSGGPSNK